MDSHSVNMLSGHEIALRSDIWVRGTLQNTCDENKMQRIRMWNVQAMLKTGVMENIKIVTSRLESLSLA